MAWRGETLMGNAQGLSGVRRWSEGALGGKAVMRKQRLRGMWSAGKWPPKVSRS